jgi:pimeloyl-ACP methyl ester carboxylesterase
MLPIFLLPLLADCGAPAHCPDACQVAWPAPSTVGIVFVADGSGDIRTLSANLNQVVAETSAPLRVETFVWSHGRGRVVADHRDHANHLAQGCRLAAQVAACRQQCANRPIFLIGHSAGCAVILAAAEMLPPNSVDRMVQLAPSVSATYDLRRALRTIRCGMDVFFSRRDRLVLGLGMRIVGTADRQSRTAAGRYGFVPVITCPADAALYSKLREYPWGPEVAWTGNRGGHPGSLHAGFLRAYVLPLLASSR